MAHLSIRQLLAASVAVTLAACGTPTDTDTDTDDTELECVSGIKETFPARDATNVFYRTTLEIAFNQEEESTATITLSEGGSDVAGTVTWSDDGKTAFFQPTDTLKASTDYTLTAAYSCDKTAEIGFTTGTAGTEIADPDMTVVGKTYNVDLGTARITEPAGIGGLVGPLIADAGFALLFSPTEYDDTANTLGMIGGIFDEDMGVLTQDLCLPTLAFEGEDAPDFSENPFFELSGENTTLSILDFDIEVASLNLSGAFAPDGSSLQGVALDLFIDTEQLADLDLGLDLGDQSICELVQTFSVNCVDCGDGSVTCLKLVADSIIAESVTDTITEVTETDIDNNVDCNDEAAM